MEFHGAHVNPLIPWNSMESMECNGFHGIPSIQWISIDSMESHRVIGFSRSRCILVKSVCLRQNVGKMVSDTVFIDFHRFL